MGFARTMMVVFLLVCDAALFSFAPMPNLGTALGQEKKEAKTDDAQTELNKALKTAASLGKVEQVKDLLKQGADIQWRDTSDNGKTPLVKAVLGGRFEVVKVL